MRYSNRLIWRASLLVVIFASFVTLAASTPVAQPKAKAEDFQRHRQLPSFKTANGHPRQAHFSDHLTSTPEQEKIEAAKKLLEKSKPEDIRIAQLILWLENAEETRKGLPQWNHLTGLAPFGETKEATSSSIARLIALTYLGRKVDKAHKTEFALHLEALADSSANWSPSYAGRDYFAALMIDSHYRNRSAKSLRKRLRPIYASLVAEGSDYFSATNYKKDFFLWVLRKHKLTKEVNFESYQETLLERLKPKPAHVRNYPTMTNDQGAIRNNHMVVLGEVLMADTLGLSKYIEYSRKRFTQLPKRPEGLPIHKALFDSLWSDIGLSDEKAPKLGLELLEGIDSIIALVRSAGGYERAATPSGYRSGAQLGVENHQVSIVANSAMLACLALAEGFKGKKSVNAKKAQKLLAKEPTHEACRTLLFAEQEHDPEKLWQRFKENQKRYFLRIAPIVTRDIAKGRGAYLNWATSMFYISDAAGVLLGMSSLEVSYHHTIRRKLFDAFLSTLEHELEHGNSRYQTYCYSLCILCFQQEMRARVRAGAKAGKGGPISGDAGKEERKEKVEPKAEVMAKALSERERKIVTKLTNKILESYGSFGFGYLPIAPEGRKMGKVPISGNGKEGSGMTKRDLLPSYADNSNSQFAMIGLKTAMVLGVEMPAIVFQHEAERICETIVESSDTRVALRRNGADYWEENKADRAKSRTPRKVTPAGIDYNAYHPRKMLVARQASPSVTSGVISSLILCREFLKEKERLTPELDEKIRVAVFRAKVFYAGHKDLDYEGLSESYSNGYHLFGVFRASYTEGREMILHRDWRQEARLIWMRVIDVEGGDLVYGGPYLYQGLITLALNGIKFPIVTMAEDIDGEEEEKKDPDPAKSAAD